MRKKHLLNQNITLFDQLQSEKAKNINLLKENKLLEERISELKDTLEKLKPTTISDNTNDEEKDEDIAQASLDQETQYAACIIGKIVVSSAEYSNRLTLNGETRYVELLNLILGRAEVAKSEILSAITADNDFSVKKEVIDNILAQTQEYFESVMAQRL